MTGIRASLKQIDRCRYRNGLYSAVPPDSEVMIDLYRNVWIRDTIYTLLAYEALGDIDMLRAGVYALVDRILLRWGYKLDWRIVHGVPADQGEYLHPRFREDGSEIVDELWGLRQDDAVGLAIWALGRWHERFGILRNDYADFHLIQRLIWYLERIDVPHAPDNGIWEEGPVVHLSSLAAVNAGLNQAARIGIKDIPERLSQQTQLKLLAMGGRETDERSTDLALLTLIWPLGDDIAIPRRTQREILDRVERELVGARGVIRHVGDEYNRCHGHSPEWTMGFGFLALAWEAMGEQEKALSYLDRLEDARTLDGELPESWCADPSHYRYFNSPLCWSHALYIAAAIQLGAGAEVSLMPFRSKDVEVAHPATDPLSPQDPAPDTNASFVEEAQPKETGRSVGA